MEFNHFINQLTQGLAEDNDENLKLKKEIFESLLRNAASNKNFLKVMPLFLNEGLTLFEGKEIAQLFTHYFMSHHYLPGENEGLLINFLKTYAEPDRYMNYISSRIVTNSVYFTPTGFDYNTQYLSDNDKKILSDSLENLKAEYKKINNEQILNNIKGAEHIVPIYKDIVDGKTIYQLSELIDLIIKINPKIEKLKSVDEDKLGKISDINNYSLARNFLLYPLRDKNYLDLFSILEVDLPTLYQNLSPNTVLQFLKQGHVQMIDEAFNYISQEKKEEFLIRFCQLKDIQKGRGHRIVEKLVNLSINEPERVYVLCIHLKDSLQKELKITDERLNGYEMVLSFIKKNLLKSKTLQSLDATINKMDAIQSIYEQKRLEKNIQDDSTIPKRKMKI